MSFVEDQDDYELFDDDEDAVSEEVSRSVDHLRDTLTHDMAMRIIPNRFGVTPANDEELEQLMEELIADAYNDGYDNWDDFPY